VDGHDAVWTAKYLNDIGLTTSDMNLDLQVHIENISNSGTINTYTGIAWSRGEVMERIEYSTDGGQTWNEVSYESVNGTLSQYETFSFQFSVNTNYLQSGYNMIIVRGIGESGQSSMISWDSVVGGGNSEIMSSGDSFGRIAFIGIVGFGILIFGAWVALGQKDEDNIFVVNNPEEIEQINDNPIEAELVEDSDNLPSS